MLTTNVAQHLDGVRAIALVLDRSPLREELFVDPRHGSYIGEPVVAWNLALTVRPGTIIDNRAVRTTIVENIDTPGEFA